MASGNQSVPNDQLVGWQANSGRRGSFEIIQTCAITVFACTWTIQHLNVPGPNDGKFWKLLRTCKWMVINILLPEFALSHAIFEREMAKEVMRQIEKGSYPNVSVSLFGWPAFKAWAKEGVDSVKRKINRTTTDDQDLERNTGEQPHGQESSTNTEPG
jgi:hypothetical protein